ncbi:MAG: DUF1761 domain-containing protein [Candidatus Andersenbacteria bacterium]|nr:DUF1761 domain-containing protein [Candidatus Andersenbacteria bacterium]
MNYLAVVAAAIASIVIGSIWYGPLFGKKFQQAAGMDKWSPEKQAEEKKKMGKLYAMQIIASLIMFYILSVFVDNTGDVTVKTSIYTALLAWIGFVVPVQLGSAIWGGSMTLFYLGAGNMLLTLLAAGAIVGFWS